MKASAEEFEALRQLLAERSGITIDDGKRYLVEARLRPLAGELGFESFAELHSVARDSESVASRIVDAMTINETCWFRDDGPWHILRRGLLPRWCERLSCGELDRVRIWSAASSTGQEAYSVAMTLLDHLQVFAPEGVTPDRFEILGTDISPSALFVAISGRYDRLGAARGLERSRRDRYFEQDGRALTVRPEVRQMVEFKERNLHDDFSVLGPFDLVLCRNVLIYFDDEDRRSILERTTRVMRDDAVLILGGAESILDCDQLVLDHCDRHLYHRPAAERRTP